MTEIQVSEMNRWQKARVLWLAKELWEKIERTHGTDEADRALESFDLWAKEEGIR